jgi:hypothetical protein
MWKILTGHLKKLHSNKIMSKWGDLIKLDWKIWYIHIEYIFRIMSSNLLVYLSMKSINYESYKWTCHMKGN